MKENDFVKLLKREFGFDGLIGIGDDTSVESEGDRFRLVTKDILVDNIHFSRQWYSMQDIALKSLAVNLSDIAAMGGEPHSFYIGLGFPGYLGDNDLKDFYKGIKLGTEKWGVQLGGGDFSRSEELVVSITMTGYTSSPVLRSGAVAGDLICVSGSLGSSAAGLKLLKKGVKDHPYISKHVVVKPELALGKKLSIYVSAMMDISDGLLLDLQRLIEASGVGAEVHFENIPVESDLQKLCSEYGMDFHSTVLGGGEDFRLLFTLSEKMYNSIKSEVNEIRVIGSINERIEELKVKTEGKEILIKDIGYDHFNQ